MFSTFWKSRNDTQKSSYISKLICGQKEVVFVFFFSLSLFLFFPSALSSLLASLHLSSVLSSTVFPLPVPSPSPPHSCGVLGIWRLDIEYILGLPYPFLVRQKVIRHSIH